MPFVIHLCQPEDWEGGDPAAPYHGTALDKSDGFIHLSPPELAQETANLYLKGSTELLVLWIEADELGDDLRYEEARDGVAFPHLYGPLPRSAVKRIDHVAPDNSGLFTLRSDPPPVNGG